MYQPVYCEKYVALVTAHCYVSVYAYNITTSVVFIALPFIA